MLRTWSATGLERSQVGEELGNKAVVRAHCLLLGLVLPFWLEHHTTGQWFSHLNFLRIIREVR